ncbi:MAG: TrkA family potassium uptake protein [Phycisphaerae bacterium]
MTQQNPQQSTIADGRHHERPWWVRIGTPMVVLAVFILVATIGYKYIEPDFTWLDSLFMTVMMIFTVGYSAARHDLSDPAKAWSIFVIVGGLIASGTVLSLVGSYMIEGRLRRVFGRHIVEHKIKNLWGHVIVCGYGSVGSVVAAELTAADRDVVVVDDDSVRIALANRQGLLYVQGDAQEESILRAAGIERADVLVAALDSDAENAFITLSARQANPRIRVIARAQQEASREKLRLAGATRVICPLTIGAARLVDIVLRPAVVDFFEIAHKGVDLEMDQLELNGRCKLVGRTLQELSLPRQVGVHVVAVRRADGSAVYHATPEYKLEAGDTLILVGKRGSAAAIQQMASEMGAGGNGG